MRLDRSIILVIMLMSFTLIASCCRWFTMADDAIFKVTGYAPSDQDCSLHLFFEGTDVNKPETIKGKFEMTYYLSFCTETYSIEAICNGETKYKEEFKFPTKNTPRPYSLGVIAP